jgi:putative endonuclease
MKQYYIYIISNYLRSTLYIGVTNNLHRRLSEHATGFNEGFTKKYKVKYLMYYEVFNDIYSAISREKQLKHWSRRKKLLLVMTKNPMLKDLRGDI